MTDEERQYYKDKFGINYEKVFSSSLREYGFVNGNRKRPYMIIHDMNEFLKVPWPEREKIDKEALANPELAEWNGATSGN
jgi:hypothetical protein